MFPAMPPMKEMKRALTNGTLKMNLKEELKKLVTNGGETMADRHMKTSLEAPRAVKFKMNGYCVEERVLRHFL